jgi:hypothetical protein
LDELRIRIGDVPVICLKHIVYLYHVINKAFRVLEHMMVYPLKEEAAVPVHIYHKRIIDMSSHELIYTARIRVQAIKLKDLIEIVFSH